MRHLLKAKRNDVTCPPTVQVAELLEEGREQAARRAVTTAVEAIEGSSMSALFRFPSSPCAGETQLEPCKQKAARAAQRFLRKVGERLARGSRCTGLEGAGAVMAVLRLVAARWVLPGALAADDSSHEAALPHCIGDAAALKALCDM